MVKPAAPAGGLQDYRPWQPEALDLNGAESHEVQLPTAESLETLHVQAHKEGYDLGFQEGREAGYQQGRAQVEEEVRRLRALLAMVEQAVQQLGQTASEELLDLALELAKQMLRQALKVRPELLLAVVRDALESVPDLAPHSHPHLYLHPADAELVRAQMQSELAQGGWRIMEDQTLERGGCRIETTAAELDATLASRWQKLAAVVGRDNDWLVDDDLD